MTKIILIRSAESEAAIYHIAEGQYDSDLTDRGWRQIRALQSRLAAVQIDGVYSSDLYRARMTAEAICRSKGLPLCQAAELRELRLGCWEGKFWGNIAFDTPMQLRNYRSHLERWQIDGAESPDQALCRFRAFLQKTVRENDGKTIVLVSHDALIDLFLAELKGEPLAKIKPPSAGLHTGICILEAHEDKLCLKCTDDVSHLMCQEYQCQEKAFVKPYFDTDLYCQYLRWVEYGSVFVDAVRCIWEESGEERPFQEECLLEDAVNLPTIIGYAEQTPVGFLQMSNVPGWMTLLLVRPDCRNAGLGTQLVGLAVMDARSKGCERLRIALPVKNPHKRFFRELGFWPVECTPDNREIYEKDIRLIPKLPEEKLPFVCAGQDPKI